MEPIIELKNIQKTYLLGLEGVPALRGVSLKVFRGEWVAIYGTSGGGKTSLLNLIGTVDKPTRGELVMFGQVINQNTPDNVLAEVRLKKLGFVFQAFNLLSSMTARENVELPMTLDGTLPRKKRREMAKASLQQVGLGNRMNHFPKQLSGGEQQRVTIARAVSNKPELLLLDEPTGDLDSVNSDRIVDMLHRLNSENGMTLLMVTHDVYLKNFAHRVIFMRDGKVATEERISPTVRAQALRDLQKKLDGYLQVKKPDVQVVVEDGHPEPTAPPKMTELRLPEDYPTVRFASPRARTESSLMKSQLSLHVTDTIDASRHSSRRESSHGSLLKA